MTLGVARKLLLLIGILGFSGCLPQGRDQSPKPVPADKIACEAKGGSYGIGGLFGDFMCFLTTPGGGQPCDSQRGCTAMCLAETRTCSTVTPMFGCYSFLDPDGKVAEICID